MSEASSAKLFSVWVGLLGPVLAEGADGSAVSLGGARLRAVLAMLALDPGRTVRAESLIDGLWGEQPPADAPNALQSLVSRLRRALRAAGEDSALRARDGGYLLDLPAERVDTGRFAALLASGRDHLADDRPADAASTLDSALALWRGDPLADLADLPFVPNAATRLTELRLAAVQERADAALRLGRARDALTVTESVEAPLREPIVALRMRALHALGRQSDALNLFERTRVALAEELGVDPTPELRAAHTAVLRGESPAPKPPPHEDRLPPRLTSFVGREPDLAALTERLSGTRLLTVVGPGGAGKTSLTTELVRGRGERVFFVPLAGVRTAEDVPAAVLAALTPGGSGLLEQARSSDAFSRIAEALSGAETVLLLDNCEHLIDAAATLVDQLLTTVPRLRVLATSREPLAINGESLYQLGPLGMPESDADPEAVANAAAVRLFVDRASAVRADFDLESTVDSVREVVTRLDGMPLALELAAARLRSMSVQQIAANLDDRFRLLTSGSRTALPRQRTLRAVVAWSWDLLEPDEAALAEEMSVFAAPATATAIEGVSGDVLYRLGSLVEKSIVEAVGRDSAEPRYRMLETIRAYAAERLAERGETERVRRAFAEHFLALAEWADPLMRTGDQLRVIRILDADYDNLIAALRWSIDSGAAELAARICQSLFYYWNTARGLTDQTRPYLTDVLAMDGVPPISRALLRAIVEVEAAMPGGLATESARELIDECVRTGALDRFPHLTLVCSMLALISQDYELTEQVIVRALAGEDTWSRGAAHWARSFALAESGEAGEGARERAAALAEFRAAGERWGMAMVLGLEADYRSLCGDNDGAIALLEEGLGMATELGSTEDMAHHLWRMANERMRGGDAEGAWRDMHAAEAMVERGLNGPLKAMLSLGFAELARKAGDFDYAHRVLDRVGPLAEEGLLPEVVVREWRAKCLASLAASEKDVQTAREQLRLALRSISRRLDMSDLAQMAEQLAAIHAAEDDHDATAYALGLSDAVRGMFDQGNAEVRTLAETARTALGEDVYLTSYRRAADLSKQDAAATLRAAIGDP